MAIKQLRMTDKATELKILQLEQEVKKYKRFKEEAEENENKFRMLFENLTYGFTLSEIITDAKGDPTNFRIIEANKYYETFAGVKPSEIIGKTAKEFLPDASQEMILMYSQVAVTGKPFTMEYFDEAYQKHIKVHTYCPKKGQFASVFEDISEQKKTEKAIIESQRLGAIGEMASSIAHDFNNALQAIYGNIELVQQESKLDDNALEYLKTIKTIVKDSSSRVQRLQRFGGKGDSKHLFSGLNINALLDDVVSQSRPLWKNDTEKRGFNITVETHYNTNTEILGNEAELRTAIYNIIKNSVEAMPKGGSIEIETGEKEGSVYILFKDTGVGMDEETKSRIFQPFSTTKGFEQGRGLGMSGVYTIIKEHKGTIQVKDSEINKGTSIIITLPFHQKKTEAKVAKVESASPTNKKPISVLWVEDDNIIRMSTGKMLKRLVHTIDTVESGKKALELLQNKTYDIVVTDIGMADMNGWQLADNIKKAYGDTIKIAVASGWAGEIDPEKMKKYGITSAISKPYSIDEVKEMLDKI